MRREILISFSFVLFFSILSRAAVPEMINYQGYLKQNGVVVNGTKSMAFSLYDASSGGALLCSSGAQSVTVTNGLFSYKIGSAGCDLSTINWDNPVYIEVAVDGITMTPREQVAGMSYLVQTLASDVAFTPAGNVAATDVQSAITELDAVNVVSSIEGVTNDEGNIDLVPGGGISIVADDAANTITFTAVAGAVDHNSLSNLATGDVHTQYFNLSQSETVAGIPAFNGGTTGVDAPFTVDSTFLVTNLNADLLDGNQATAFVLDGCTDCLNATEVEDIYVLNTGDSMTGSLGVTVNSGGNAVGGTQSGAGNGIYGITTGTGRAGYFVTNNATGSGNTVQSESNSANNSTVAAFQSGAGGKLYFGNHTGASGNLMQLQLNGTDKVVVDHNGRVGIGAASPSEDLYVENGVQAAIKVRTTGPTNAYVRISSSAETVVSFYNNEVLKWHITNYSPNDAFNIRTGSLFSTSKLVIQQDGTVGIGTTTPVNKLDIAGAAAIGATYSGTSAAPANGLIVQGNVGIGKNTAATALDVNGTVTATAFSGDGASLTNISAGTHNHDTSYVNVTSDTMTGALAMSGANGDITFDNAGGMITLAGGNISDSAGSVNINDNVSMAVNSATVGFTLTQSGSAEAGTFYINNGTNNNSALKGQTNGGGNGVLGVNTGTGGLLKNPLFLIKC